MLFAIVARDSTAPGTLEKRLAGREAHMKCILELKAKGVVVDGGALLDNDGRMIGSIVFCEAADRSGVDEYLAQEIYYQQGVWNSIEVTPFKRIQWA
ncbi:YciI family protein [Stutzerimonas azotifigens]|uniref:YciI family protein n=1 Tax=Stutzerimonas azotifigens TaxID=291995 RepID=UPI000488B294|nr:YciI family protein [Stutzerimonas azotifigens]